MGLFDDITRNNQYARQSSGKSQGVMNNTCLLSGKGMVVSLIFSTLVKYFPDAVWKTPKMKWWQTQTRHELRLHNLTHSEILELKRKINVEGSVPIMMEIF